MSLLPLVTLPAPALRLRAGQVRLPNPGLARFVDELFETMRAAGGVGLAAPQVGRSIRLAVVEVADERLVLVNPEIVGRSGRQLGWEGCLSVPHTVAPVERALEVVVRGRDLAGHSVRYRRRGLVARAIEHEVDHLEGRLCVDLVEAAALVDTRLNPSPPPLPGMLLETEMA